MIEQPSRVDRVLATFDDLEREMSKRGMRLGPGGATGGEILAAAVNIVGQEDFLAVEQQEGVAKNLGLEEGEV